MFSKYFLNYDNEIHRVGNVLQFTVVQCSLLISKVSKVIAKRPILKRIFFNKNVLLKKLPDGKMPILKKYFTRKRCKQNVNQLPTQEFESKYLFRGKLVGEKPTKLLLNKKPQSSNKDISALRSKSQ